MTRDARPADPADAGAPPDADAGGGAPKAGRLVRARAAADGARERVDGGYQWLQDHRASVAPVDVVFTFHEDDRNFGGSLLAGALAFRLFLWILPAALLIVAGLGFGAAEGPGVASRAVRDAGITSIARDSVNNAAQQASASRWFALVFGAFFLYTTSVALLKALFVAHALVWQMTVPPIGRKPRAVAELLLVALAVLAATSLASVVRSHSAGYGLVAMLADVAVYAGAWWFYSTRLPHAGAGVMDLLPGALLVGVGVQVLHLVTVYYLAARLTRASLLYGTLGAAAAVMFGLYLAGRMIIAAAGLNATLWRRKQPPRQTGPEPMNP